MSKIKIKTPEEIELIREACRVTKAVLDAVSSIIQPGITTEAINDFVHSKTLSLGATPSPLNYKGFPKSVCTSVNDVICHGIPSPDVCLKAGDIINVDVTSCKDGYHGDASRMYLVGGEQACSKEAIELVRHARNALYAGIKAVRPGARFGDIGAAIQRYIDSTGKGYGIVREYTGHGIGKEFHEEPHVVHYGRGGHGAVMEPGMVFTIEPMINLGGFETSLSTQDGWTVRTKDGSLSAQWEHTVCVTEEGYDILTE